MDLIDAAKNGSLETVLNILESGCTANLRDKDNATALYWSACHGHDDVTEVLILAGCDVSLAVRWGSTALHAAADRGHLKCIRILIDGGANPNSINNRGDLPLHIAAYRGFIEITNVLLLAGSDVNLTNEKGKTPRQEALEGGHHDIAEYIRLFEVRVSTDTRLLRHPTVPRSHITGNTIFCNPQSNFLPVTNNRRLPSSSTDSSEFNDSFPSSMSTSESSFPEDYVDSGTIPTRKPQNVQLRRSISFAGTHLAYRNISPIVIAPRTPSLESIPVEEAIHRNIDVHDHTHFKSEPFCRSRIHDINLCPGSSAVTHVPAYGNNCDKQLIMNVGQHLSESVDQNGVTNAVHSEPSAQIRHFQSGQLETIRPVISSVGSIVGIIDKNKETEIHVLQNQLVDSYKQIETLTKENENLKFKSSTLLERLNNTESRLSDMFLKCETVTELLETQNKCLNLHKDHELINEGHSPEKDNSGGGFKELVKRFEDIPNLLEERLCETLVDLHFGVPNMENATVEGEEWLPGSNYVILGDPPVSALVDEHFPDFVSFPIRHLKTNKCYVLKMKITVESNTQIDIHQTTSTERFSPKYQSQTNVIKIFHQFVSSTERLKKFVYIPPSCDQKLPQSQLASRTTFLVTPYMFTLRRIIEMCRESKLISKDREENVTFWIHVIYQLAFVLYVLEDKELCIGDFDEDSIGFDEDLFPYFKDIENVIDLQQFPNGYANTSKGKRPDNSKITVKSKDHGKSDQHHGKSWKYHGILLKKNSEHLLRSDDITRLCLLFYNVLFSTKAGSTSLFPLHNQTGNASAQRVIQTEQALCHILSDAIQQSSYLCNEYCTPGNICTRLGFLLYGSGLGKLLNKTECRLYHNSRMLEILSKTPTNYRKRQHGELTTIKESTQTNKLRIEALFLSQMTSSDLWRYCKLFEQNGLSLR